MERLTKRSSNTTKENGVCCTHFRSPECCAVDGNCSAGCNWEEAAWSRFAAYEDTGLTPKEVHSMYGEWRAMMSVLNSIGGGYTRLRELAEADRDGRLVVRPYSIGETVYVLLKDGAIFYPETNGWYISEEIIEAISHDGFYLGDPVDDVYTPDSEIGKTVFLTREEAKAALEEMKNE